jgi:hypothetical protein
VLFVCKWRKLYLPFFCKVLRFYRSSYIIKNRYSSYCKLQGFFHSCLSCFAIFFIDSIDDEDEVLLVLAEELPNLSPFLGGSEYIPRLLVPLENLAAIEDGTVRDKVRKSDLVCHGVHDLFFN